MAAPILAPGKPVTGDQLGVWFAEIQARLSALETPQGPTPLFAVARAGLPAASSFINCAAFVTDLGVIGLSNGTHWVNAGTGATIA